MARMDTFRTSQSIVDESFNTYKNVFVQRYIDYEKKIGRYAIKHINGDWTTKHKPLADPAIRAHLNGEYYIAVFGQWYPKFAIQDFDEKPRDRVEEIRGRLGFDENNSMLFSSESSNSYHLIFKPRLNNKPPTLRRLCASFSNVARLHQFEIYPQASRAIRLPFGAHQRPLDESYYFLNDWQNKLYWFNKLDEFNLEDVENQQLEFILSVETRQGMPNIRQEAIYLLDNGLQGPSSRQESQFKILFYLWRNNLPCDQAQEIVWEWINKKHNGFSKDIINTPWEVKAHIQRQAAVIWQKYELNFIYPDSTHNGFNGFISKPDIGDIIEICGASMPRMKFLFHIVKYSYPRRHRDYIGVHRDKLVNWASKRTYLRYLNELEARGHIERGTKYLAGVYSKGLKLNWKYRTDQDAILYDGRSVDTFEDTIKLIFQPREFRDLLIRAGGNENTAKCYMSRLFKKLRCGQNT